MRLYRRPWIRLDERCVVALNPTVPLRPGRIVLVYPTANRGVLTVRDAQRCRVVRVDAKRRRIKVTPA